MTVTATNVKKELILQYIVLLYQTCDFHRKSVLGYGTHIYKYFFKNKELHVFCMQYKNAFIFPY